MIKLTSEIINGAATKAGTYNIDFLTQNTLCNALNDCYRELYTQVAQSDSDYYWKEYLITEDDTDEDADGWFDLPTDLFIIKSVVRNNTELQRCPPNEIINGQYTIKNNKFKLYGNTSVGIRLFYVPLPQLVTCPAPSEEILIERSTIQEYGKCTEKGFYYKTLDGSYFYSFENKVSVPEAFVEINDTYDGYTLEYSEDRIQFVDPLTEEVEIDLTEDYDVGPDNPIKKVVIDEPYMMTTYADGTIIVAQNFVQTLWNINAKTGHKTKGIIHTMKTNDNTLYGCVYEDEDGKLWRASFVPDTVLNYPTNTLFKVLEIDLACLLMSMNGINNEYISNTMKQEAIAEFRNELRQCRAMPMRMQNQLRQRMYL